MPIAINETNDTRSAADVAARGVLSQLFPDREIVMLDIDALAAGGGGIHCATQQQPAVAVQT